MMEKTDPQNNLSILKHFLSFIPQNYIDIVIKDPDQSNKTANNNFDEVVLFSDISGFTPMSEALAQSGTKGTEEMSHILNQYLEDMIQVIKKHHGIPQKIAGDALTVFFPRSNKSWANVIIQALYCADNIQHLMNNYNTITTSAGNFHLSMKIGISKGRVVSSIIGSKQFGIEHIIAGQAIDMACAAEKKSQAGEIWIDQNIHDEINTSIRIAVQNDHFYRITKVFADLPVVKPIKKPPLSIEDNKTARLLKQFRMLVPKEIAERVELGFSDFLAEHRKVTVLFVSFEGLSVENPDFVSHLNSYYAKMQHIINKYKAYLYEYESGDKGHKIIAVSGAPSSTDDDEELALLCALEIQQATKEFSWFYNLKIGCATGFVYCGVIGNQDLRRYALIGDTINLSARVMSQASDNSIYLDRATKTAVSNSFVIQELKPVKLKGKKNFIPLYRLDGLTDNLVSSQEKKEEQYLPIGREQALTDLHSYAKSSQKNGGRFVVISGSNGVGKGAFVRYWQKQAAQIGYQGLYAVCSIHSMQNPYSLWQQIFVKLLNLDDEKLTMNSKIQYLRRYFQDNFPQHIYKLPLLGRILGLNIEDNEWTKQLDVYEKRSSLKDLISDIIFKPAQSSSLFYIIVEDIHFSDISSRDLMRAILSRLQKQPVIFILTHEPWQHEAPKIIRKFQSLPGYQQIILQNYSMNESAIYIEEKFAVLNMPPSFLSYIHKTTNGNPFFLNEMLTFLLKQGRLDFDVKTEKNSADLDIALLDTPDSLQNLITSRLDKLNETEKLICKIASVIGQSFTLDILNHIFPARLSEQKLLHKLKVLIDNELIVCLKPDWEFGFRNNLIQEVAYSTLSFDQRHNLHFKIAQYIEEKHQDNLDSVYHLLAFHYYQSEDLDKKIHYLQLTAERAINIYAYKEAIPYLSKLLPLIERQLQLVPDANTTIWEDLCSQIIDIHINLADAYRILGKMDKAQTHLHQAQNQLIFLNDEKRRYTILRNLGEWSEFSDNYQQALQYYQRATNCIMAMDNFYEQSLSFGNLGNIYRLIGRYESAFKCYFQAAQLAVKLGDEAMLGRWMGNVGSVHMNQGKYDIALEFYKLSLEISIMVEDKNRQVAWLNLMGEVYISKGEYQKALSCCQQSLDISRNIGYRRSELLTLMTIGSTYAYQGKYDQAVEAYEESITISTQINAKNQEVIAHGQIGDILRWKEQFDQALIYYEKAKEIAEKIGDQYNIALWERGIGIIHYSKNPAELKLALRHLRDAAEIANNIGHQRLKVDTMIHLGYALVKDGELDEAKLLIENGIQLATEIDHPGLRIWGNRILAALLHELGFTDQAVEKLKAAIQENQQLGLDKELAECYFELGLISTDVFYLEKAKNLFERIHLDSRKKLVETTIDSILD